MTTGPSAIVCGSICLVCVALLAGCESPNGMRGLDSSRNFWSGGGSSRQEDESRYRKEYQTTRSRKALRWLLANRLEAGMPFEDVSHVIGEKGALEENSGWLKSKRGTYRVDDKAYRYGPDDRGEVIYLFFRDGKLVNYDPNLFADSPDFKSMKG